LDTTGEKEATMDQEPPADKATLLQRIHQGWDEYQAYLATLSEEQLTVPADDAGWTAKDHIIHVAIWEHEVYEWLTGHIHHEALELDQATLESGTDQSNAAIRQRYRDLPLDDALRLSRQHHEQLMTLLESWTAEEFLRPYRSFDPSSDREDPVVGLIPTDTYEHYREHLPWIAAIVKQS
jgi:hypothetical protein